MVQVFSWGCSLCTGPSVGAYFHMIIGWGSFFGGMAFEAYSSWEHRWMFILYVIFWWGSCLGAHRWWFKGHSSGRYLLRFILHTDFCGCSFFSGTPVDVLSTGGHLLSSIGQVDIGCWLIFIWSSMDVQFSRGHLWMLMLQVDSGWCSYSTWTSLVVQLLAVIRGDALVKGLSVRCVVIYWCVGFRWASGNDFSSPGWWLFSFVSATN